MREIVKRETIETSIVGGRSAARWGNPACRALGRLRVSVSLGSRREVVGRWVCPSGQAFIDYGWHAEPGLRCASAVLWVRARSSRIRTTRRPSPSGAEVVPSMQVEDADEMVLNDPS